MAFKMRSPLHNEPVGVKYSGQKADLAADTKGKEQFVTDNSGTNTTSNDKVTNSNTGAEEDISGEDKTMADKLIEENSGEGSKSAEQELYDYNPAMYARRKARQDKRNIRRKQRESRIVGRQYGVEEGRKVDDAYTGPRSMGEATYENPDMREKRLEQDKQRLDNIQKEFDDTKENLTLNTPTLDAGSFVQNKFQKPKLSFMSMEDDSPMGMKPNRAGRPINSNILMTSPVIKTGKHSAKDAVAKLKLRNIAQSE